MKINVSINGDLAKILATDAKAAEGAVTTAVRKVGDGLKSELRAQVVGAGLGRRLANAVRSNIYPEKGESLSAAAFVYARPGKGGHGGAANIVAAFEDGSLIRANGGTYLAIPTEHVPMKSSPRRPMTPGELKASVKSGGFGQELKIVPTNKPGVVLLVMPVIRSANGKGLRPVTPRRISAGQAQEWVAMFILVRQVQMPRLLDWKTPAENWGSRLEGAVLSEWEARESENKNGGYG